jgi:hypothetical protein
MFLLYQHLAGAGAWLSHALGANRSEALGLLPTVILAVSQHAAHPQHLPPDFVQHMLLSFWPLLLVVAGTVLSRDQLTCNVSALPKKDCGFVDLTIRRSTLN